MFSSNTSEIFYYSADSGSFQVFSQSQKGVLALPSAELADKGGVLAFGQELVSSMVLAFLTCAGSTEHCNLKSMLDCKSSIQVNAILALKKKKYTLFKLKFGRKTCMFSKIHTTGYNANDIYM